MQRPITTPLPADLPENWETSQIIAPTGAEVGLTEQHGYNYQSEQINAAQNGVNALNEAFDEIAPLASPALTGTPTAPTPLSEDYSTRIATTEYVINTLEVLEEYAPIDSPIFAGTPKTTANTQYTVSQLRNISLRSTAPSALVPNGSLVGVYE